MEQHIAHPIFKVSTRHLGIIDKHMVCGMSLAIDLPSRSNTWHYFTQSTQGKTSIFLILLHVTGGNDNWYSTIHALRYWYQLPEHCQEYGVERWKQFSSVEKKLLVQNPGRLLENLSEPIIHTPPRSNGISARQSKIQMDKLIQLSKDGCISKNVLAVGSLSSW